MTIILLNDEVEGGALQNKPFIYYGKSGMTFFKNAANSPYS